MRVIHGAVGAINESDVMLAAASGAIIVGFNVRPDRTATDSAAQQGVDMRMYRVIYDAIEEMEQAMKGSGVGSGAVRTNVKANNDRAGSSSQHNVGLVDGANGTVDLSLIHI